MERRTKLAAAGVLSLVLAVAMVAVGAAIWAESTYERSYTSSYGHDLYLETNGTLENVTLRLPAGVHEGEARSAELFVEGGVCTEFDVDVDWTYSVVETEHGPMLELSAEQVEGRDRLLLREFDEEGRLVSMREVDSPPEDMTNRDLQVLSVGYAWDAGYEVPTPVDTRHPLEAEPVLQPKYDVTEVDCAVVRHAVYIVTGERCYAYETVVYAEYDAPDGTRVNLRVEFDGSNEWWIGGWSSNWYTDSVSTSLDGSQTGWTGARGYLSEEAGSYRDRGGRP